MDLHRDSKNKKKTKKTDRIAPLLLKLELAIYSTLRDIGRK